MNEYIKPTVNNNIQATPSHHVFAGQSYVGDGVNLNEIFQSGMQKHVSGEKKTLSIVRSDKLPVVNGQREQFVQLLNMMIEMIVSYPPAISKLFLYVKCEVVAQDPEITDLRPAGDQQMYTLCFYTNITTDDRWKLICKERLAECSVIAAQNRGSFSFFPICNTGCIFSLTLPGKIV